MLNCKTDITVRFSDVDSLGIVWHGNYVQYFEDARETFGALFQLSYLEVFNQGYVTPIVHVDIDYKKPLKYGDKAYIELTYVDSEAAKIIFDYKIFKYPQIELIVTGRTVQVFLNINKELVLTIPSFFLDWKKKFILVEDAGSICSK